MMVVSRHDWSLVLVMLMQAMIGAISKNFRQVSLEVKGNYWLLHVVLERDSFEDREEINDIADELSIYLEGIKQEISCSSFIKNKVEVDVVISRTKLLFEDNPRARLVFRRKEA